MKQILFIEDEETDRQLVIEAFPDDDITFAESLEDALDTIESTDNCFFDDIKCSDDL